MLTCHHHRLQQVKVMQWLQLCTRWILIVGQTILVVALSFQSHHVIQYFSQSPLMYWHCIRPAFRMYVLCRVGGNMRWIQSLGDSCWNIQIFWYSIRHKCVDFFPKVFGSDTVSCGDTNLPSVSKTSLAICSLSSKAKKRARSGINLHFDTSLERTLIICWPFAF